jgi:hypothetical protein
MDAVMYLLSVLLALAAYAAAGVLLWVVIEGGYFIYCKLRGIEY